MSDSDLLRQFAAADSQAAFAELVRRRIDLVYSAALRQLAGDTHRAQDVTQEVFVALARKAQALANHPDLLGWLFTSTHFAAVQAIRAEQRRKKREHASQLMPDTPELGRTDPQWERVWPLLDGALHELPARDRQVVLLRFFDKKTFAAIGEMLGLSENAAQKNAERALEKLQAVLARRGVTSTGAALGAALAGNVVTAAPPALAAMVTQTALAGATTASLVGGTTVFMSATKISIAAGVAIAAIATGIFLQTRNSSVPAAPPPPARETSATTTKPESAEVAELRARLAATEKRAESAEGDNTTLLQAISDFRAAPNSPPPPPQPKQTRDPSTLSREEVLAELTGYLEKQEAKVRAMPGYRPYQEPDETLLTAEQRASLDRSRERVKAKGGRLFVSDNYPHGGTVQTNPIYESEMMRNRLPQLTPDDRKALDERWARVNAEQVFAENAAKAAQKASSAK